MPYQVIRVWADGRTMDYGKRFNRTAAKDALHASLAEDERPFSKAEPSYAKQIDKMQVGEEKKIYPAEEEECGDYFLVRMVSSLRRKAEAEDPEFKVGSEVCVHGLVNYPEYNGRFGRVKSVTVEGEWAMFILEWANPAEGGIKLTDKFLLPARMGPNGMEVVKRRKVESDVVCDKIKLASDLFKDELISKEKYDAVMVKACTTLETVRFALENKCIPQELVVTVFKKLLAEGNVSLVQCAKLLWIYGVSFVTMEAGSCREKFLFFYGDMFGGEKETYAILAQVFETEYSPFETEYSPEDAENDRSMHGRIGSILLHLSGDTEAKLRTFKFVRATLADTTQPLCDRVVSKFLVNQLKGTEREVLTQCKKFLGEGLISEAQYGIKVDTMLAF